MKKLFQHEFLIFKMLLTLSLVGTVVAEETLSNFSPSIHKLESRNESGRKINVSKRKVSYIPRI